MLTEDINNTTDWVHISYGKIAEGIDKLKLTVNDYRLLKKLDWVVTEKIHGANFSITTDGKYVRFAKRKELLLPTENFFGHKTLINKMNEKVYNLYQIIREIYKDLDKIIVYGELFGGSYPHPEVVANQEVEAIQTGICYSPNIEFCAFDIAVETGSNRKRIYLDYDKAVSLLKNADIMHAEPLFTGKLEDALNFRIGFKTGIPKKLGLPEPEFENKAEGIVIKPVKAIFLESEKGLVRPIIKKKIAEFEENDKFHEARNWNKYDKDYKNIDVNLIIDGLKNMINVNRLNCAVSKIGKVTRDNDVLRNKLKEEIFHDVVDSFTLSYSNCIDLLHEVDRNKALDFLEQEICKLVNGYLE